MARGGLDSEVSGWLRAWAEGDSDAGRAALPFLYDRLRRVANRALRSERDSARDATELVHELWLRLAGQNTLSWNGRGQFLATAARLMRQILVDQARRRLAAKRGGRVPHVTLSAALNAAGTSRPDLVALDDGLTRLADEHPRPAQVVEMRYFAGLTERESAELLGVSEATIRRDLRFAEAWLRRYLRSSAQRSET